ncbi:inhibitor of KinA [Paenibacillus sp. yr247]|uniref:5-oxoprolinase subunit PxpB n=1 Tax=Paenibacillus sp. yr247 TaxID=1761880 RepID=UPI00088DA614|nr:5-oxoprolinase subunit PxpB [Paenibacillus sp. yr247]SDN28642.1 inhibitor of KinA [Paenibacillus sp. yr247]
MKKLSYECHILGDSAIVIGLGADIDLPILNRVRQLTDYLEKNRFVGFIEMVTAYTSITIYYDSNEVYNHYLKVEAIKKSGRTGTNTLLPYDIVFLHIQHCLDNFELENENHGSEPAGIIEIPVCYGEGYGPDLKDVAAYHRVSTEEIVHLHSSQVYPVYMIGFAPGFPYLGGLDDRLVTPRKSVPRMRIPAGSVGIGGAQTGIYPFETPGGWNLIGRTPLALFLPESDPPSLLKVGDQVRFVPITQEQFDYVSERNMGNGL